MSPLPVTTSVHRNGNVLLWGPDDQHGRRIGKLKKRADAFVRHYKTRPPRYYSGFQATALDGTVDLFRRRRDAVGWLVRKAMS